MKKSPSPAAGPDLSVVILNYNGNRWLDRCLDSLRRQTVADRIEVILADNASTDGSDRLAARLARGWKTARFQDNGGNLGFCEGNNRGAESARGEYLFFLNNDTWLEPDCLEVLLREVRARDAQVAAPRVLNYDDDSLQTLGAAGFDAFGLLSPTPERIGTSEVLACPGCALLIRRDWFRAYGGFDAEFFMYAEEYDLSWRTWLAGGRAICVGDARLHHRGAANVNPAGEGAVVELRTSDTKRYYANRNNLLVLLKNAQHLLLLLVPLQVLLITLEGLAGAVLLRRPSFFRRTVWDALRDVAGKSVHIQQERERMARLRERSDFGFLRFLRFRLNRWEDLERMRRLGSPRVEAR